MLTNLQAKILTLIENSKITDGEKEIISKSVFSLNDEQISLLVGIFLHDSKNIEIYAQYLLKIGLENELISKEKLLEILENLFNFKDISLQK